ncbi:hypothetical protein [Nitrosopumilus sp. S4]
MKISCGDSPAINFNATKDLRIIDIIDIPIKVSSKPSFIKQLSEGKELAKKLKEEKITLEIRLKGEPVLKLGEKANPKLAKIVTLSGDIEITDIKKLKTLSSIF